MGRTVDGDPAAWKSGMVDLSDMSLSELSSLPADDDSPLAHSRRRVAEELASPDEPIAGFNSAL